MSEEKTILNIPWPEAPEEEIYKHSDTIWCLRTGIILDGTKRKKCYEDSKLSLLRVEGDSKSPLGYILRSKVDFNVVYQTSYYLSLFSSPVKNTSPKELYKDSKVHLYRFNGQKTPNYWFLLRTRQSGI